MDELYANDCYFKGPRKVSLSSQCSLCKNEVKLLSLNAVQSAERIG